MTSLTMLRHVAVPSAGAGHGRVMPMVPGGFGGDAGAGGVGGAGRDGDGGGDGKIVHMQLHARYMHTQPLLV